MEAEAVTRHLAKPTADYAFGSNPPYTSGMLMKFRVICQLVVACLGATSRTQAQTPVDCDAVKAKLTPVELTYRNNNTKFTVQVFRGESGNDVMWSQSQNQLRTTVSKVLMVDGYSSETQTSSTSPGRLKNFNIKWEYDGLPKHFDRRTHVVYKAHTVTSSADGTIDDSTTEYSYRFKSESRVRVGACVLTAVRGEVDVTNSKIADRKFHSTMIYFPELRMNLSTSATSTDPEISFDDIKTSFTPLTQIE